MTTPDPSTYIGPINQPTGEAEPSGQIEPQFRVLKWNERVLRSDFIKDDNLGYQPWTGITGFQADSFTKTIYRKLSARMIAAKKVQ
jgi:hypothetical protein